MFNKPGRKVVVSGAVKEAAVKFCSNGKDAKDSKQIGDYVEERRKEEHIKSGGNSLTILPPLSNSTRRRLVDEVAPEKTNQPSQMAPRRLEAYTDLRNHLSNAVVAEVVLAPTLEHPNGIICADMQCGFDGMSIMLGGVKPPAGGVRTCKGTKKDLDSKSLSISRVTNQIGEGKTRCIKMIFTTESSGWFGGDIHCR